MSDPDANEVCEECEGTGIGVCGECDGACSTAWDEQDCLGSPDDFAGTSGPCPGCKGTGRSTSCYSCDGTGSV